MSPILYAIYNRKAIETLRQMGCDVIVYADDIAVCCSGTLEENCTKLIAAVSELKSTWCTDYNQQLSEEKSVILHFGSQINGAAISTVHFGPDLSLEDGSVIKAAYSARHLGITLDARLSFSEFIHQHILKLRQVVGGCPAYSECNPLRASSFQRCHLARQHGRRFSIRT